ncbi:redox-regulated ATPase YchF [Planctomycetaceae bacterium SH139]
METRGGNQSANGGEFSGWLLLPWQKLSSIPVTPLVTLAEFSQKVFSAHIFGQSSRLWQICLGEYDFGDCIPGNYSSIGSATNMEAGIVGLPNVGKSTLFNALTSSAAAQSANYPFCTIEPNEGVVSVPDPRLGRITAKIKTLKVIPAALKLVDIAGIVKGASEGEGLGNKFLSHIRQVDAILQVVRCFSDPDVIHVSGTVDPLADIEIIEHELMFADIESLEGALAKAERTARSGDKDAKLRIVAIQQCIEHLTNEAPLRTLKLPEDQARSISSFGLLSAKPILYVANVDDDDLLGEHELAQKVREYAEQVGAGFVPVCAQLEAEIAELEEDDRSEMLDSIGLTEPALAKLARETYRTLGLQSYFTAGEKEVRAWTIPIGATAPEGAGVIHTDFQKGFIRAEVYSLEDLETYGSEKEIRAAGKLRVEGKAYIMQDGDICNFLFN